MSTQPPKKLTRSESGILLMMVLMVIATMGYAMAYDFLKGAFMWILSVWMLAFFARRHKMLESRFKETKLEVVIWYLLQMLSSVLILAASVYCWTYALADGRIMPSQTEALGWMFYLLVGNGSHGIYVALFFGCLIFIGGAFWISYAIQGLVEDWSRMDRSEEERED